MGTLSSLDAGIIVSLENHIYEYGYTKTIAMLDNMDQYGLAQFAYGLYRLSFYQPTLWSEYYG